MACTTTIRALLKTVPIAELTFDEASELAYFGQNFASIYHCTCPEVSCAGNIEEYNGRKGPGTVISDKGSRAQFKAIAAKDGITAIKIKSSRMLLAYGF